MKQLIHGRAKYVGLRMGKIQSKIYCQIVDIINISIIMMHKCAVREFKFDRTIRSYLETGSFSEINTSCTHRMMNCNATNFRHNFTSRPTNFTFTLDRTRQLRVQFI